MPPLPVFTYLPFQPEYGVRSSILMFESEVGINVAATRQDAGRLVKTSPSGAVWVMARDRPNPREVVSGSAQAGLAHARPGSSRCWAYPASRGEQPCGEHARGTV
jgi:hypothetical protein